jgi:hypothetical protein
MPSPWLVVPWVIWFVRCWFVLPLWARVRGEPPQQPLLGTDGERGED